MDSLWSCFASYCNSEPPETELPSTQVNVRIFVQDKKPEQMEDWMEYIEERLDRVTEQLKKLSEELSVPEKEVGTAGGEDNQQCNIANIAELLILRKTEINELQRLVEEHRIVAEHHPDEDIVQQKWNKVTETFSALMEKKFVSTL